MRQLLRTLLLSVASVTAAMAAGCASIVSGTNQSLSVVTQAPSGEDMAGASCSFVNDKGSWYVISPGSVTVHRSYGDLTVNCKKEGVEPGMLIVKSSTKGMAAGNLLFGGVIGVGVDAATGAAYDYPDLIHINLGPPSKNGAATGVLASTTAAAAPVLLDVTPSFAAGDRITFIDVDPRSGGPLGEVTYLLSSVQDGEMTFNGGDIVIARNGAPVKGVFHGTGIYGIAPSQLLRGGTWTGMFRAATVSIDIPVQLTVLDRRAKVISGRTFDAARIRIDGNASRENSGTGGWGGAPINGEMLVDMKTGLVLEIKVTSRHPNYLLQREVSRIAWN